MIKRLVLFALANMWIVMTIGLPDGSSVEYQCQPHRDGQDTGVYVVMEYSGRLGWFDCIQGVVFPPPVQVAPPPRTSGLPHAVQVARH